MRRRRAPADEEDEEEPEEPDEEEDEDELPSPPRRRRPRRPPHGRRELPRWESGAQDSGADDEDAAPEGPAHRRWRQSPRERWPVYYRARDSVWFEPAVALAIIVLLLVSLWAYTQNWPPVYVVESSSMQHGTSDQLGLINTGDLVLAQHLSAGRVVPYVVGMTTGYTTYGEYGDVLLYYPGGQTDVVPVIHRAIAYLEHDADGTYSVPELAGLPCGNATDAVYRSSGASGCGTSHLNGTLTLRGIGWQNVSLSVQLSTLGGHSGFLTMGDNNVVPGTPNKGVPDQPAISTLVEPGWILGAARGMIPWFGAIKLLLASQASEVPSQSWQALGLTLAGAILIGFGVHYAFRAEGVEDPRRRAEEEAQAEEPEEDEAEPAAHRFRLWRRRTDEEDDSEEEEAPVRRTAHRDSRPTGGTGSRRGRPHPKVRKDSRGRRRPMRDWKPGERGRERL